jgi:predicted dehydrogenase
MKDRMDRREFIKKAVAGGMGWLILKDSRSVWGYPENNKLNIAFIAAGGRGGALVNEFAPLGENIVALCDVDESMAAGSFSKFPKAKRYKDFRKMLDEMHKEIDAVVVATPDHTHAIASVSAMRLGKHVYCEKPLTWSIYEARVMRKVAMEQGVMTQMGNQGAASDGTRQAIEIIQSGAIGHVREVHVWTDRPIWPQGIERPKDTPPVPPHLDWDLWIGPAPYRPYHPAYHPFRWRGWWDFGTGALGDIGCHSIYMPFVALKLDMVISEGMSFSVEAESSGHNRETFPKWSIIRYEFPERGTLPPLKLVWYDGGKKPPKELLMGEPMPDNGVLLVGDKGTMFGTWKLLPANQFKDFRPPEPKLPRSPGHQKEWINACKGEGPKPMSNFVDYASYLTEIVLAGNLALWIGGRIEWDSGKMEARGCPEVSHLVRREYRKGWTL